NTQTTFQDFRTYKGVTVDQFGTGAWFRALPGTVPDSISFSQLNAEQKDAIGKDFRNIWNTHNYDAGLNSGWNFNTGSSIGKFGFNLGGVYTRDFLTIPDRTENQYVNGGAAQLVKQDSHFVIDDSAFKSCLGGLLTTSYKLTDTDKLFFRALVDHSAV